MSQAIEGRLVYVIDDDEGLRQSLDSLFRSVGLRTRLFGSAKEFVETNSLEQAGCLIVDVRMPGLSGLDFQDQLVKNGVSVPIILITGHGDIPMTVRAMKAGAVDFLAKPFRDQDMLDAVAGALQLDQTRRDGERETRSLRSRFETLSPREQQVMMLVTKGLMNKQAAAELGLSEVTVKIHRGSAMRKMTARTLADLVKMAEMLKLSERDGN